MTVEELAGKTILRAELMRIPKYDDEGWLKLAFTDGTSCVVVADYGAYTGNSEDEYPVLISVQDDVAGLVPVCA